VPFRDRLPGWYKKAHKRLSKQPTDVVQTWAESAIWATQAGLEGYRATRDEAALEEAVRGACGILASVEILLDRERSGQPH
jgi:hypothetical protein